MQMRATALKGNDEPNDVIAAGIVGKAYENRTLPVSSSKTGRPRN